MSQGLNIVRASAVPRTSWAARSWFQSSLDDDRTNIIVSQQCGNLVFGDWASAAIFVPRRVWISEKFLHHLLRCYFPAALSEHRPQSCKQLHSGAGLIWSAREVNRRPTCLLGPTTTSMLRTSRPGTTPLLVCRAQVSRRRHPACRPWVGRSHARSPARINRVIRHREAAPSRALYGI